MVDVRRWAAVATACLCLSTLTGPAVADESDPSAPTTFTDHPVPFRPILGAIPTGQFRSSTLRAHRLVVVPLYSARRPDPLALRALVQETRDFYAREIPGMTLRFTIKPAVKAPRGRICEAFSAWSLAAAPGGLGSLSVGEHLIAVVPECRSAGMATEAPGYGRVFIGAMDAQMLGHEFGHNLGLLHGDVVECTTDGAPVPLSRTCKEYEYADLQDVMGASVTGASLTNEHRVAAVEQSRLTGRVRGIPASTTTAVMLTRRGTGTRAAVVRTEYGTVLFDVSPGSTVLRLPNDIQAHLATRNGSGLLRVPQPDGSMRTLRDGLELGDTWTIPGSRLRVVVAELAPDQARLVFSPTAAGSPPPAAPSITGPAGGIVVRGRDWTIGWSAAAGPDIVAFQVQVGSGIDARVPAAERTAVLAPISDPTSVVVWAVGANGLRTASPRLVLTPVDSGPEG